MSFRHYRSRYVSFQCILREYFIQGTSHCNRRVIILTTTHTLSLFLSENRCKQTVNRRVYRRHAVMKHLGVLLDT